MIYRLLFFFLISSLLTFGQNKTIKGRVTDSNSGSSIEGAVVFISQSRFAYTNPDGIYIIKNLDEDSYTIKVSHLGYKSLSEQIKISNSAHIEKNFSLDSSPISFDEVLVKSSRFETYLRNSPYSELLVGSKQIGSKPFQSLPDILKEESGISILSDGVWGTEVSIRGLSRENVVTLIDGNRIATSTDVAARLSMIDMNDIERVEIIKGASSSIYGSGATGGIINIITKPAQSFDQFTISGSISTGFNSVNNLQTSSASINSGGSFWSSKLASSYRKAGNTQTPSGELKNSQFKDYSFSGALNILPLENNIIRINYQLFKAEDVGIPGASVFPENADVRYPDERRELISTGYEIQNISKFLYKLSAKYSYQSIDRNVENIPHSVQNIPAAGTTPAKRVSVLKITPGAEHKNNNIQLQGNLLLADNNNLILGIDYWDRNYNGERQKVQKIEVLNAIGNVVSTTDKIIGEKPLPDSKYRSLGLYAQDDAELVKDKLSLSIGTRLDKVNVSGEATLNPIYEIVNGVINYSPAGQKTIWNKIDASDISYSGNIGLKYSADTNLDFTLSLGLSFRSPSLEERFQYIDQGSYVRVGDPNLKSESGKSADLGIRYYSSNFKFVSSVFFNYFNDLVAELPGTFEGRNAYIKTNIGEARLYGFDLRADYNFYKDYVFYATTSFVQGDDITANGFLPEIPPLNGNIGIKFNLLDKAEADFSTTYFIAQNNIAAGEMQTPGYAYFSLYCSSNLYHIGFADVNISVGVDNIFDKEYRNHLSTGRGLIRSEAGRNVFIKLNLNL